MSKLYQKINGSAVPLSGGVGVINNLNSTSTTDALSANMGKELNEGKADKSTTYTKTEIDALIGDVETLLADL